jgi:hypothetical protein
MPSIDPSGISISKYTTYFVPLKQSNRLVGIAGGKDVVASVVQFIGCGQTDECFIFDNYHGTQRPFQSMLPAPEG